MCVGGGGGGVRGGGGYYLGRELSGKSHAALDFIYLDALDI